MTEALKAHLYSPQQARAPFENAWQMAKAALMAGHRMTLELKPEKRSDAQNRRLWALLTEISEQVEWYGQKLTAEDFKHIFTAALKKQRVVPGIDGGFVILGQSTSKMSKADLGELMELIVAFGAERGVIFKDDDYAAH